MALSATGQALMVLSVAVALAGVFWPELEKLAVRYQRSDDGTAIKCPLVNLGMCYQWTPRFWCNVPLACRVTPEKTLMQARRGSPPREAASPLPGSSTAPSGLQMIR